MKNTTQELRDRIAYRIREGFESEAEILENALTYDLRGIPDGTVGRPEVERLVAELLAAQRAEQAAWEGPNDCDRPDQAFSVLNRHGIVARQNLSCCSSFIHNDIWE